MGITDNYKKFESEEKEELFTELLNLKEAKSRLDKKIKELENGYKDDVKDYQNDLFYQLNDGRKFSIKASIRKGSIDYKKIENDLGVDLDEYRKEDTLIHTLRIDK